MKDNIQNIESKIDEGARHLYSRYTSTSALAGFDSDVMLHWSIDYFNLNFAKYIPESRNANILEIGCGYGKNIIALKELGYVNVSGIDLSEEQVDFAKSKLKLNDIECIDVFEYLSKNNQKFDCILLIDVIEHFDLTALIKLGIMLEECLTDSGKLIIQVPNDLSPMNPIRSGDLTHIRAFTPQSLNQYITSSNMKIIDVSETQIPIRGIVQLIRKLIWKMFLRPVLNFIFSILHGKYAFNKVFTANLICIAHKAK